MSYRFFLLFVLFVSVAHADTKNSLVKIYTVHNNPDVYNPWSMQGPRGSTGSGAVISGKRILTNT